MGVISSAAAQAAADAARRAAMKKGKTEVAAFTDDAKIGSWAKNYVAYFVSHGVVNGMTDGSFAPAANMTREQAMKVAVEALDK